MLHQVRQLIEAIVPTNRDRYVKGANSRAVLHPETISEWRRQQQAIPFTAQGGWYFDDDAKAKARRRVERFMRNHPQKSIPRHIAEKGMRA